MSIQDRMIGKHPTTEMGEWLTSEDIECTESKRHRYLEIDTTNLDMAIEDVSKWLITYHLSDGKKRMLTIKKKLLIKHKYEDYAKKLHIFPRSDKTKKGNIGEIILSEYLSVTTGIPIVVYKLHYNPNIDQSMKGDDVLIVDANKILLGESKYRATPSKSAVEEASKDLKDRLTLPLSLGFIADRLFEQGESELGEMIFELQFKNISEEIDLKNIGFLFSTKNVRHVVETHLNATNSEFIFISLGIDNPNNFIENAFSKAEDRISEGSYEY